MQKSIVAFFAALMIAFLILMTSVTVAYAAVDTLAAENGKLLQPSGLELEAHGAFDHGLLPGWEAHLSYGAFPAFTITGQFLQDGLNHEGNSQTILKVQFSPMHGPFGYTAYAGYDLGQAQIPMYGLTLWSDLNYLYAFVNLESRVGDASNPAALWLTPGASIRLGSRLTLSGEVEAKPDGFSLNKLRLGAFYALNSHLQAKATLENSLNGTSGNTFALGMVAGL